MKREAIVETAPNWSETGWNLYHIKSPIGEFIGVAKTMAQAREHWGARTTILELSEADLAHLLITWRAEGKAERVFIAF